MQAIGAANRDDEVLVASTNLTPGQALTVEQVRWEKWPSSTVDPSFITHDAATSEEQVVKGSVVRAMILPGQPITKTSIVHGDASGFMAATLSEGMRAISISVSVDSSAGGFHSSQRPRRCDPHPQAREQPGQGFRQDHPFRSARSGRRPNLSPGKTRTVIGKVATVEVTPEQAELIAAAAQSGVCQALRPLSNDVAAEDSSGTKKRVAAYDGPVSVIRYGLSGSNNKGPE